MVGWFPIWRGPMTTMAVALDKNLFLAYYSSRRLCFLLLFARWWFSSACAQLSVDIWLWHHVSRRKLINSFELFPFKYFVLTEITMSFCSFSGSEIYKDNFKAGKACSYTLLSCDYDRSVESILALISGQMGIRPIALWHFPRRPGHFPGNERVGSFRSIFGLKTSLFYVFPT